jgi:NSS family neurotransmitter:Na+ symporter
MPDHAPSPPPDRWSGRTAFLLATIGSAVGIGSIWKFPYEVGANGGSVFLFFYLAGLAAVVVPLMFAEFAIGRRGRGDVSASLAAVAGQFGASPRWRAAGAFGVATGFLILSFYSVIGGWTLGYGIQTATLGLPDGADAVRRRFEGFLADPWTMLALHGAFLGCTALVVARGVGGGIETACKVLMPLLVALMLGLVVYSALAGDLRAALRFLFAFDAPQAGARAAIEALGLGFFSIGVGLGLMVTYAAYAGAEVRLSQVAVWSVAADTAISLMAGLAVFPIVFAHGLDPAGGPGLVFVTLPLAFARMPMGQAAAVAFFLLLFVAALASAISLLEIVVATAVRRLGWSRPRATALAATACFVAGVPTVLSFNLWSGWFPLAAVPGWERATFFELLDDLTSNLMLPAGGLAIALFAARVLPARLLGEELGLGGRRLALLRFALRWLAPACILAAVLAPLVPGL